MISKSGRKWIAVVYLLAVPSVDPQMMFPMFPPPPVHIGVPMPFPMPFMVQGTQTTQTTTTTETPVGVGFMPMPMPMPAPFAFPAFPASACQGKPEAKEKPKSCPPCPPCVCVPACTPAFFSYCSPCHQKCRCRSEGDTPTPIPPPRPPAMGQPFGIAVPIPPMFAPPPPPVVVMPFPPSRLIRPRPSSSDRSSECTDTDTESEEYSSSEGRWKRWKKYGRNRKKYGRHYRRQFDAIEVRGKELVKPVLTYLSRDGNVKLKRRLTNDEAAELMNDKPYQNIHVVAGEDNSNMQRVSIISNPEMNSGKSHRRRQMVLSPGAAQRMLGEGKKELVFRPPSGKKISNLSVSFQISE